MEAIASRGSAWVIGVVTVAAAVGVARADLEVDGDLGVLSVPGSRHLPNQMFDPARNTEAQHYYTGSPAYTFSRVFRFELAGPARVVAWDVNSRADAYVLGSLGVSGGVATGTLAQRTPLTTLVPGAGEYYLAYANNAARNPGPYPQNDPVLGSNLRFDGSVQALPYVAQTVGTAVTLNAGSPTVVKTQYPNDPDLDPHASRYAVVPFWVEGPAGGNTYVDFLFGGAGAGVQWGLYTAFNPGNTNAGLFNPGDFWLGAGDGSMFLPTGVQMYAVFYSPAGGADVSFGLELGNASGVTHAGVIPAPVAGAVAACAAGIAAGRRRRAMAV